ncbi:signal peptidase I [Natronoarchaeum mannanilyticum]|uniref:Signal peptidase I n=1 Tax=Natronoarchaeum mannanilyticum TaxID=926360 RepID=A0AAV3T8K6_9EURY
MDKRRVAKIAALLVLVALVVPFAVYAVPGAVGADHSFVVLSDSMSPEIESGDAIIVEETDPASIQEGDVITFVRSDEGTPVTHRVSGVDESGGQLSFETKGDANEQPDPTQVPAGNVIGAVAFTIPYIGYVIQFANTALGFVLLVALPLAALAGSEVWLLVKRRRDETARSDASHADAETEPNEGDSTDDTTMLTIHPTDLKATTILLALVAPYAAYVAVRLQTPLTFAVAFASLLTGLAAGGLLLVERYPAEESSEPTERDEADAGDDTVEGDGAVPDTVGDAPPDAATDGGSAGEVE